jgi:hypothetical protein
MGGIFSSIGDLAPILIGLSFEAAQLSASLWVLRQEALTSAIAGIMRY